MILAADYFWNGGDGPAPADLPYDAGEIFTRAYTGERPIVFIPTYSTR